MAYTVLARRYRSQDFDQVVGQEPIARTLRAAIDSDRLAHAYLFCGTRGVGKTSMARIFAKAINGGSPEVDKAIMAGQDTDTIEIDGASNNSVENSRDLIANSVYRPMRGKKKIYIIDEVHMLSTAAFNALLKTMEEPPEHVMFVLCTTDPQKVPATIQSRCQRFDFRNIPTGNIAAHLKDVAEKEGQKADPELLHAIARLGNGSMRDALSLLDRVMATGQKKLTLALLEELLGLPDRDLLSGLIDALAGGEPKAALEAADGLLAKGTSIDTVVESLLDRLRDLMVLAACGAETALVDLSDAAREDEAARATRFDAAGLVHMIALCENVQRAAKSSSTPRALLDALLVRLAMTEKLADVTAVVTGSRAASAAGGNGRPLAASGGSRGAPPKKR
ncbi:MAG: DNA polymerase III subunit gamma/tau [Phycisphaerales bacterium]